MLEEKFQRYIREHALVEPGEKILVTVSGGVDSMVMLALFVAAITITPELLPKPSISTSS